MTMMMEKWAKGDGKSADDDGPLRSLFMENECEVHRAS